MKQLKVLSLVFIFVAGSSIAPTGVLAQDAFPYDNANSDYHPAPRYRESESHPLRVIGYILHPIGWVFREVIFRPLSYFASSTETTSSVMGFREPFDYRQPTCFSADDAVPDCRATMPFNYDTNGGAIEGGSGELVEPLADASARVAPSSAARASATDLYFPDVNFDFNRKSLNDLGRGRVKQLARILSDQQDLRIVLEGHADAVGTEGYNEKLGLDRAETVREALISEGVPAERLSSVTFGESKPIFSEEENWARAVNRRVSAVAERAQFSGEVSYSGEYSNEETSASTGSRVVWPLP